nr:hypothetical protein [Ruania albidiflava]
MKSVTGEELCIVGQQPGRVDPQHLFLVPTEPFCDLVQAASPTGQVPAERARHRREPVKGREPCHDDQPGPCGDPGEHGGHVLLPLVQMTAGQHVIDPDEYDGQVEGVAALQLW